MRAKGSLATVTGPDVARPWTTIPEQLRARGLRWTPQRRILVEVLSEVDGHVTGADLVERCRARDPDTIPSTVYRTLDVLEDLGVIRHSHGADGREEFHVLRPRSMPTCTAACVVGPGSSRVTTRPWSRRSVPSRPATDSRSTCRTSR